MIKTFNQAVKFLDKYIPTPEKKYPGELGLVRMKYLMDLLGNPQLKYPTIHVGGTSGKGSTATIIASILSTKYKVGLHTSPHLVSITERIKVSQQTIQTHAIARVCMVFENISDREFVEFLNKIISVIGQIEKSKYGHPSYFEIVTAMAFLFFAKEKVDIAVIEVGMGGRYDATNVINPLVAVLTNVGLDHTEILGDTVDKIAEDKAGIIKEGIEVVSGVRQSSAVQIIELACKRNEAKLSLLQIPSPRESHGFASSACHSRGGFEALSSSARPRGVFDSFSYHVKKLDSEGSVFDYYGKSGSDLKVLKGLTLTLLGEHQVENATLAIRAIELLSYQAKKPLSNLAIKQFNNLTIGEDEIRAGLKTVFIPGRLEIVRRKPLVILDGAHNPDKMKALVQSIKTFFPNKKVKAIVAIKEDKNAKEMLEILLPICQEVIFTGYQIKADQGIVKSYDPRNLEILLKSLKMDIITSIIPNPRKALDNVVKSASKNDLILVTGSLYLLGKILEN